MKSHSFFYTILFLISVLSFQTTLFGLSVGGLTPSRQGYITFPTGATDNVIVGAASLENGFKLEDNGTTCSYDGLLPISGPIDLIGGDLYLMESLTLANTTVINTMGSIYGNGKTLKLAPSIRELRSTGTDLLLTLTNYNMGFQVNSVDFSTSFSYVVAVCNNTGGGSEIQVLYYDGTKMTVTARAAVVSTQDGVTCRWQPGTLNFAIGITNGTGSQLFTYRFNRSNGTLTQVSSGNFPSGQSINSVAWSPGGNYLAAGRDITSNGNKTEVFIFGVTLAGAISPVSNIANFAFPVDHAVSRNAMAWSPGGNYFAVGTAAVAGAPDLLIFHFNGTTLTQTIGLTIGRTSRGLDWSPTGTFIAVAFTGSTTNNVMIYTHDISNGTLSAKPSANINQTTDAISVSWASDGNRLLVGTSVAGGISALRQYNFNKTVTTLSLVNSISYNSVVNSVNMLESEDTYLFSVGNRAYISGSGYVDGFTLTFNNLNLQLTNNIILGTPLGIRGNCSIQGNRNSIDFDTTGTIILLSNSRLYLKDLTLKNFGGTQLRCLDNTSTISLDNVTFNCKSPYFFNNGSLQVYNNFTLSGTNPFIYKSSVGSMIHKDSLFLCDYMSTFSYDPISNNRYGMQMADRSSSMMLRNATLYSTATGLILRAGNLLVDGMTTIKSDGVSFAEAIQWGDGLTFTNDVRVTIMPGARCNVQSGYLVDRNLIL